jgi:hypothetical protein
MSDSGITTAQADSADEGAENLEQQVAAEQQLADSLGRCAGEWVAVKGATVVAHSEMLHDLLESIDQTAVDGIFQVAEEQVAARIY